MIDNYCSKCGHETEVLYKGKHWRDKPECTVCISMPYINPYYDEVTHEDVINAVARATNIILDRITRLEQKINEFK